MGDWSRKDGESVKIRQKDVSISIVRSFVGFERDLDLPQHEQQTAQAESYCELARLESQHWYRQESNKEADCSTSVAAEEAQEAFPSR